MEYEEYLAKANSGAFQAASPGPPSGKTIAGKRGENITTLLPSSAFQRAMAEQTMVALLWQQGDARGTLNLPASTKVEDLKLRLNASDCDAVMFDAVIIEVRKAGSVVKRKLDTQKQDAVVDPSWTLILSKPPAEELSGSCGEGRAGTREGEGNTGRGQGQASRSAAGWTDSKDAEGRFI